MRALLHRRLHDAALKDESEELAAICDVILRLGSDTMHHSILATGSRWSRQRPSPWQVPPTFRQGVDKSGFVKTCFQLTLAYFMQAELARVSQVCKYWRQVVVQSPDCWRTWTMKRHPPGGRLWHLLGDSRLKSYLLPPESLAHVQKMDMNGGDPFLWLPAIAHVHEITNAKIDDLADDDEEEEHVPDLPNDDLNDDDDDGDDDETMIGPQTKAEATVRRRRSLVDIGWRTLRMTIFNDRQGSTKLPPLPLVEHLDLQVYNERMDLLHLRLDSRRLKSFGLCGRFSSHFHHRCIVNLEWIDQVDDDGCTSGCNDDNDDDDDDTKDEVKETTTTTMSSSSSIPMLMQCKWPLLTDLCITANTLDLTRHTPGWDTKTWYPVWELFQGCAARLTRLIIRSNPSGYVPLGRELQVWPFILRGCPNLEHLEIHDTIDPLSWKAVGASRMGWAFASKLRILKLRPDARALVGMIDSWWLPPVDALTAMERLTLFPPRFGLTTLEYSSLLPIIGELEKRLSIRRVTVVFEHPTFGPAVSSSR